ncbi:MAG TPA: M48 family metalloprotease [Burkholderiales bacterium]|nr:M48 family metalloprotease [Burkholderiales bacterium]
MKPLFKLWLAAMVLLPGLSDCATNPVTGNPNFVTMTESQEINMGRQFDVEVRKQYHVYQSPDLQKYVNDVGQKLAHNSHRPNIAYHFTVLDSTQVNAFALPGGYIYITRGLIEYLNSEAEMGAVLGHEIGHVTARHSVQQISAATATNIVLQVTSVFVPYVGSQAGSSLSNLLGNALLSGYGREHELEADHLGAVYLGRTGYDPQAMIKVLTVLKNQELFDAELAKQEGREPNTYHGLFATHPDNDTRLKKVISEGQDIARPDGVENREAFLQHINGMTFGDSPEQGIIRKGKLYHSELGLVMQFPDGWRVRNYADHVQAQSPTNDAGIELRLGNKAEGSPADYLRNRQLFSFGEDIQSLTINGLPAATTETSSQGKPVKVTVIYFNNRAFFVLGVAASKEVFNRYRENINATTMSFHAITEAERVSSRPLTIKIITARPGVSYADLARTSPLGKNAESYLRLINAQYPSGEPEQGQKLKIVE